jgi:invasion protein IalB
MDLFRPRRPALLLTLSLAAGLWALGMAPGLQAQETTPEAPAEVPAETPPAGPTDLSMGVDPTLPPALPNQADAAEGETYLSASFDKWELRCVKMADGSDPCQLYQLLLDESGNDVAEISMFALPEGNQAVAGATVVAPLETLLTAAMQLAVDRGKAKIYPFTFCTRAGCVARIGFTAEEVAQLKAGAGAVMTIVPAVAPDQKVNLTVSLKGFTAGFEAVKAANAGQQP